MKKYHVTFCLLLAEIFVFLSCATNPEAKQLDLSTIEGNIPIYSISVVVNKSIDKDDMGKSFIQKFCSSYINDIKDILHSKGININVDNFIQEYNNSQDIQFEEIKIAPSFVINRYFWTSQNKENVRIELSLSLVVMEDGTMPLSYTIKKDDPDYAPGYKTEGLVKIKFDTKS